jgi:hypothetical protein
VDLMQDRARRQIDLIVAHELGLAKNALASRVDLARQSQSARGMLRSGNTIIACINVMESLGETFLRDVKRKVRAVCCDLDGFALFSKAMDDFLGNCDQELAKVVLMIGMGGPESIAIQRAARERLEAVRTNINARLAIARFDFEQAEKPSHDKSLLAAPQVTKKKGGRLPAEFWDDMWAAIAVALYDGTLQPKRQSDIERAMLDWLSENGHSAAPSTVRGRARRLWDRMLKD